MTKIEAAKIFGGRYCDLARALAMTRGGISQWPDQLTQVQCDRVLGAAIRLRKPIPEAFRKRTRAPRVKRNGNAVNST